MGSDLLPSERVLWTGKPVRFPLLDRSAVFLVPFTLLWAVGLGFMWWRTNPQGIVRVLIPVVMTIGMASSLWQLLHPWLALKSTEYTVTDQRVIAVTEVFGRHREQSAYLADLPPATLVERDGGVGVIRFGDSGSLSDLFPARGGSEANRPFVLREIENARQVRDTIATARATR